MDDGDDSRMVEEPRNRNRVEGDRSKGNRQRDVGKREIEDGQDACR